MEYGNKPFYRWSQLWRSKFFTPAEKLIIREIIEKDTKGFKFQCYTTIAENCGLHQNSVKKAFDKFVKVGLITKQKVTLDGYSTFKAIKPIINYHKLNNIFLEIFDEERVEQKPIIQDSKMNNVKPIQTPQPMENDYYDNLYAEYMGEELMEWEKGNENKSLNFIQGQILKQIKDERKQRYGNR